MRLAVRWQHEAAVCHGVNDPRWPNHQTQWAYDFTNQLVWEDKKAMVREMLVDYEADGIELGLHVLPALLPHGGDRGGHHVHEPLRRGDPRLSGLHRCAAGPQDSDNGPRPRATSRQTSPSDSTLPRG